MSGKEEAFIGEAFRTNWVSTVGPHLTAFEQEFAQRVRGRSSVALGSGTAALHLCLRLAGVDRADEVVCPTLTFVASANPIVYQGATPIFADSEKRSWNLDPNALEDAFKRRPKPPKAVVVVHLFGQTADLDPIQKLCERYGSTLIEDAAEALGADYNGVPAGAFGAAAAFSFNGNKIITTSGGGMLVTEKPEWAEKARFWSQQAREPGVGFEHRELGYNYRLSNLLAGVGRAQLQVLDERVAQRRAIAFRYRDAFKPLGGLELMPQAPWGLHTNWLSCFLVDSAVLGCTRDDLIQGLAKADIEARPVWKPLHEQELYRDVPRFGGEVAHELHTRGICLPSSSFLDEAAQGRVIDVIYGLSRAGREVGARSHA
jgi:pyridoxal phosphate-dependent aminotransferase EpsN